MTFETFLADCLEHLAALAQQLAQRFWQAVCDDARVSADFKAIGRGYLA